MDERATVTNIIELIGERQTREALILCGESPAAVQSASDYDVFKKLLEVLPMLTGHATLLRLQVLFQRVLRIETTVCEENAERLWREAYERFFCEPRTCEQWLSMLPTMPPAEKITDAELNRLYANAKNVSWLGNDLIHTETSSWHEWEEEMTALLRTKADEGIREILFRLPPDYVDGSPNVYAVEQCLQKKKKDRADEHLLLSQAIRFACVSEKDADICIILQAECAESDLTGLLKRIEKMGKQSDLLIMSTREENDHAVMDWLLSCKDPARTRLAIDLSETSKEAIRERLSGLATHYPIGRVVGVEMHPA